MHKHDIIERALAGGLIGSALGALLTGKSRTALVSAIVGAAVGASINALNRAREHNLAVMYEEKGILYKQNPDGSRKRIRAIQKSNTVIPPSFSIA